MALMVAMHSNLSLAEIAFQQTPQLQETASAAFGQEGTRSLTWPLLSGESVEKLAVLFYPKNKKMQRLFVAKTLLLSRDVHPNLNPSKVYPQASLIVIPNIKYLAKKAGKIRSAPLKHKKSQQPALKMSYALKDAAQFTPSPEMQAKYLDLVKRNEILKLRLEKLNAKLAHLQQVMVTLAEEEKRSRQQQAIKTVAASKGEQAPQIPVAQLALSNATSVPVSQSTQSEPLLSESLTKAQNSLNNFNLLEGVGDTLRTWGNQIVLFIKQNLATILIFGILALASLALLLTSKRRRVEIVGLASVDSFRPISAKAFSGVMSVPNQSFNTETFALTASHALGNNSSMYLDSFMALADKEESELVLEQARIYVEINRENEAISLLEAQVESAPLASLPPWLYLLKLYRKTEQQEKFLQYARKLNQSFNVETPEWEQVLATLSMAAKSSLEDFPHVVVHLTTIWSGSEALPMKTAEAKNYLDSLLKDNRKSERSGFALGVFQEVLLLRNILDVREKMAVEVDDYSYS